MKKIFIILLIGLCLISAPQVFAGGSQTTSGVTAQSIIDQVRDIFTEPSASFLNDQRLLDWVNYGIKDISGRTRCLEFEERVVLTSNTTEYSLSTNYISINDVIYMSGATNFKGLKVGPRIGIGNETIINEPVYWYEIDGRLGIYPIPEASGNTLYVSGVELPSGVTIGEAIPTPSLYDHALVYYVTAYAYYKERMWNIGNLFMTHYLTALQQFRKDIVEPSIISP